MRRPSLQFYPGDWQSNPKLRRCSHAEKGLWLDVMCILHDQDEYGVIRWPLKDLALAVHAKPSALQGLVSKGVLKGADTGQTCEPFIYRPRHSGRDGQPVTLIDAQEGPLWYSSRMVRDEHIRLSRSANEPKSKQEPKPLPKVGIGTGLGQPSRLDPSRAGASSSSSASSSTSEKKNQKKEGRAACPPDPRVQHPAIQAVWKTRGRYPLKELWDMVIETVGDDPDLERMKKCWLQWRGKGFSSENYGWLTDWYINGEEISNGTYTQNNELRRLSAAERNNEQLKRNRAVVEKLRRESGGDPHEVEGGNIPAVIRR